MSPSGTATVIDSTSTRRCIIAADLHCDGSARRLAMLEALLRSCRQLDASCYLLGDLFDVWLGPGQLALQQTRREVEALQRAVAANIDVVVIPGNRDFLLDEAFERATGVVVGGDHLLLETGDQRWHLSHGDLFGTADVGYQRLRKILRSGPFRMLVRHMPLLLCRALATFLRRRSRKSLQRKDPARIQPDLQVIGQLVESGFDQVVCGHYHRPSEEFLERGGSCGIFTVLEAFEDRGAHLFIEDGVVELRYLPS
ncbi:MAG: UDP-2,3-diacylglucosamine diphosphatase [Planctomycetota bacterium]|jgi:UDP-2,3-diacylglucosamine hydrolase|nr:UDP-2,3-diacylglucosamine diphosphatase [Planctomycetota bacterium]